MALFSAGPRQSSQDDRRELLAREFVGLVEPWLEAGESYADVSVARLIEAAGISRSTFYVYFDDKGDLLGAMTADVTQSLAEAGAGWFELSPGLTRPQLHAALAELFRVYRVHRTLLGAITEFAATDRRVGEAHVQLVETAIGGVAEHIARLQAGGCIDAGVDAMATAQWLVWMLERGLHQLIHPADDGDVARLLEAMTELIWRALYVPMPGG